jgi:hypothetical protein
MQRNLQSTLLAPARGAEVAPLLASRGCSCIEMTSQPVIARTTFEAGVGWAYLTQSGEIWVRRPAHSQRQFLSSGWLVPALLVGRLHLLKARQRTCCRFASVH